MKLEYFQQGNKAIEKKTTKLITSKGLAVSGQFKEENKKLLKES